MSGHEVSAVPATMGRVLVQIMLLDIVFSFDSVITAVGMVDELGVMIAAVVIAVIIMLISLECVLMSLDMSGWGEKLLAGVSWF